jgi:hypothetical protein
VACCVAGGIVDAAVAAVVAAVLFETAGLAASGATLAEPGAVVVPLAAGADVEVVAV